MGLGIEGAEGGGEQMRGMGGSHDGAGKGYRARMGAKRRRQSHITNTRETREEACMHLPVHMYTYVHSCVNACMVRWR